MCYRGPSRENPPPLLRRRPGFCSPRAQEKGWGVLSRMDAAISKMLRNVRVYTGLRSFLVSFLDPRRASAGPFSASASLGEGGGVISRGGVFSRRSPVNCKTGFYKTARDSWRSAIGGLLEMSMSLKDEWTVVGSNGSWWGKRYEFVSAKCS